MKRFIWTLPLALLGACSSLTPTDDPVYLRLNDIEARMLRLERVLENESLIQLSSSVDQMRADLQELRGEVETLRFETQGQAERQRELYLDVDERLQALEQNRSALSNAPSSGGAGAASPGAGAQASGGPGSASPQTAYDRAFELIQARQYEQAATAFREFLERYPGTEYAANAQYWLAETYYVRSQFGEALPEFQGVLDDYPRSSKVPDALLKVGYCNYELGNIDEARMTLREVQAEYPDTTAARLARQRLDQITREAG